MSTLGDRIKRYEAVFNQVAVPRNPVIIRVDGRAFHSLLRGSERPFNHKFMDSMVRAAWRVAGDMQGFKVAYIQSDEVTFCLTDYDTFETQGWFNYEINKLVSISAALMSVNFSAYFDRDAVFDARVFSVPKEDVANVFLWRAKDWQRNSLQMYARAHFSHKELHGQGANEIHQMLHDQGLNWATDLSDREKNGTFILKMEQGMVVDDTIGPFYNHISQVVDPRVEAE